MNGLFDPNMDLPSFKTHLRDFLVSLKEFAGDDNNDDLYSEEKQVTNQLRACIHACVCACFM